jgi:type II secretory pathway pseudopilin PulG
METDLERAGTSRRGRQLPRRGLGIWAFTLIEMLVALGLGTLVFLAVASLTVFTTRSFVALGNYDQLDQYSRNALDVMSREIRQARKLVYYRTNWLVFEDHDGTTNLVYHWDPAARLLTSRKGATTTVLLTNCDYLCFDISQRNPSNNFSFYPATNNITGQFDPTMCKLVSVSWICSRTIMGAKANTESVQTAKIVMRN